MVTNPARQETDSLLEELEKRIANEYSQAADELQKKADKYFQGFAERDAKKKALVESGELKEKEYIRWRRGALQHGRRYEDMIADLTNTAVNADKAAMAIVNGSLQDTFRINANYGAYEVERASGIDTNFTLYNKDAVADLIKNQPDLLPKPKVDIPLDRRWNRQHMNSAITQGILQGDSIDNIAKRLTSVTDMDSRAAIRNARTMTTAAENAGSMHSYKRAEEMGIKGKKMWMATHDNRTRESHAMMDGETRDLDEAFSNGLQEPGDSSGDPSEVYNCRCRIVYVSNRSQLKQYYDEQSKKVVIDGKSYGEWKQESYVKWVKRHETKEETNSVYGTNKNGQEIVWSDKANSPKWEEPKKIIKDLSEEFETKLEKVEIGSEKAAGRVQISGSLMFLSSNSPSTVFHEFAHTISLENQTKFGLYDEKAFWKDIAKVQREYKRATQDTPQKWISTYEHSSKGHDEFFAEAFTQAMLIENGYELPNKYGTDETYSKKVIDIVKKYFKR